MIVEDFTVTDMVAKCELISNNTFTQQLTSVDSNCKAENNAKNTTAHQIISSFGEGSGDFDNADKDNGWNTNNEGAFGKDWNLHCFLPKYQTSGFCSFDASAFTFMNYAQDAIHGVAIPACSKDDSGSSLLQNS